MSEYSSVNNEPCPSLLPPHLPLQFCCLLAGCSEGFGAVWVNCAQTSGCHLVQGPCGDCSLSLCQSCQKINGRARASYLLVIPAIPKHEVCFSRFVGFNKQKQAHRCVFGVSTFKGQSLLMEKVPSDWFQPLEHTSHITILAGLLCCSAFRSVLAVQGVLGPAAEHGATNVPWGSQRCSALQYSCVLHEC